MPIPPKTEYYENAPPMPPGFERWTSGATPAQRLEIWRSLWEASNLYGVPWQLAAVVIQRESNGRPLASSGQAVGVMQLKPSTARGLGVTDPFDIRQNIHGGVKYLAQKLREFRNVAYALGAYNAGPGTVRQTLNGYRPFKKQTQNYIPGILENLARYYPEVLQDLLQKYNAPLPENYPGASLIAEFAKQRKIPVTFGPRIRSYDYIYEQLFVKQGEKWVPRGPETFEILRQAQEDARQFMERTGYRVDAPKHKPALQRPREESSSVAPSVPTPPLPQPPIQPPVVSEPSGVDSLPPPVKGYPVPSTEQPEVGFPGDEPVFIPSLPRNDLYQELLPILFPPTFPRISGVTESPTWGEFHGVRFPQIVPLRVR